MIEIGEGIALAGFFLGAAWIIIAWMNLKEE